MQTVSLCSVFKLNNKNVNTLIDRELSGFYLHSFTNNELEILHTVIHSLSALTFNYSTLLTSFLRLVPVDILLGIGC